jgi:hypothetical protein
VAEGEAGFGHPALGAGGRVEQPGIEFDLSGHDARRVDPKLAPLKNIGNLLL